MSEREDKGSRVLESRALRVGEVASSPAVSFFVFPPRAGGGTRLVDGKGREARCPFRGAASLSADSLRGPPPSSPRRDTARAQAARWLAGKKLIS